MKYKDLKIGLQIHHVDFDEEIGVVTDINKYYFIISYPNRPISILTNPYQADYSELNDFCLFTPLPPTENDRL